MISEFLNGWQHFLWLALAILIEVVANILLKLSNGFKNRLLGCLSLLSVLAAFGALSKAIEGIDLAVAYALWGGVGLLATLFIGRLMFNQHLNRCSKWGVLVLLVGMTVLKLS